MIIYFYTCLAILSLPNDFIGHNISIKVSSNTELALNFTAGMNLPIIDKSDKFTSSAVKIIRDSKGFYIKRRSEYLCVKYGLLKLCQKPFKFEILKSRLGYRIKHKDTCIIAENIPRIGRCSNDDINQEFIFDLNSDKKCKDFLKFPIDLEPQAEDIQREKLLVQEQLKKIKNKSVRKVLKKVWKLDKRRKFKFSFC